MAVILVTGGRGFVGSYVVRQLESLNHDVRVIDSLEPRVHGSKEGGKHVGSIGFTDLDGVDVVIHLAAQVGVADSMIDPVRYLMQNSVETAEFLQEASRHRIKRLVVASSMSIYGDPKTSNKVTEEFPCIPASVYGLTKYDQERLCLMWGEQYNVPTVALRFFNIYGPGQALKNPYTGVIANFANWLLSGHQPVVYEDGQQTRDFIYVTDVANAVVTAATSDVPSGPYNICTSRATSVLQMAEGLAHALCVDITPCVTGIARPGDIRHCVGSPWKFIDATGWTPQVGIDTGLKHYAECLRG